MKACCEHSTTGLLTWGECTYHSIPRASPLTVHQKCTPRALSGGAPREAALANKSKDTNKRNSTRWLRLMLWYASRAVCYDTCTHSCLNIKYRCQTARARKPRPSITSLACKIPAPQIRDVEALRPKFWPWLCNNGHNFIGLSLR